MSDKWLFLLEVLFFGIGFAWSVFLTAKVWRMQKLTGWWIMALAVTSGAALGNALFAAARIFTAQ